MLPADSVGTPHAQLQAGASMQAAPQQDRPPITFHAGPSRLGKAMPTEDTQPPHPPALPTQSTEKRDRMTRDTHSTDTRVMLQHPSDWTDAERLKPNWEGSGTHWAV